MDQQAITHPNNAVRPNDGRDGDAPDPAIARAILALRSDPGGPGPVDRAEEAAALAAVTSRIEALLGPDPIPLRRRLAEHVELLHALALTYLQRSEATAYTPARVALVGIATRAMATAGRLSVILGASAPDGDTTDRASATLQAARSVR